MGMIELDEADKAELHIEAQKLIARYGSPLETVKALIAYNCELEAQIVAIASRYPSIVTVSYNDSPPRID
jgi:hypothetical protein